ncbi:MAG TPA: hypothetical protein ENJ00_02215 [Phycisphaerales bacterium]|nr:hypothetical protein [Phycisphaerales bacterium]
MRAMLISMMLTSGLACSIATANAEPNESLPISAITLYRSGVGSFERRGTVTGNTSVDLRFKAEQINDILKSLVVLDFDGGRVGAVSYSADEPISRKLESLGLNRSNLTLGQLLGKFQGAEISIETTNGPITGRILGVEIHTTRSEDNTVTQQERWLSVMTADGFVTVREPDIRSARLLDPELQHDLTDLLIALSNQRTEQSRIVGIDLHGSGERRIMAAYVQETPIWKTTYRLVLPEKEGDDLHIEGWAIVENTTDQDWEDVSLSLVAGQPVGFRMDLAKPLYLTRPELPVPVELAAAPKAYERGTMGLMMATADAAPMEQEERLRYRADKAARSEAALGNIVFEAGTSMSEIMASSTQAMASSGDEGEVFFYKLDNPVSIQRQQSAMIPIITGPIEGRRVSIFSPDTSGTHPYRGIELTNSTGLKLMPGPLSVYDSSVFAGDSQIGYIGDGEHRMLAYAVDLDLDIIRNTIQESNVRRVRIIDGVIQQTMSMEQHAEFTLDNHDTKRDRTVVVEVPRLDGWELISKTKPYETTANLYRFEIAMGSNATKKLEVTQQRTQSTSLALTSMNLETLISYQRQGAASQEIVDAFRGYRTRRAAVEEVKHKIADNEAETERITKDSMRIRDLMRAVSRQDALYSRYLKQLEAHEDRIDALRRERESLKVELNQKQRDLDLYVRTLRVE